MLIFELNILRKTLNEEGYLKISENLKYKVTLYDSKYSGKINVTAVTMDVLSKQSKAKQLGGMFNFTPCIDDKRIERILLGYDEKGREVFWSVGHDELSNLHLVIRRKAFVCHCSCHPSLCFHLLYTL